MRIAGNTDPFYVNDGEFVAAAASLRRGDAAPLLRIAANNPGPLFGDGGDPAVGSVGLNAAAQCTDLAVPWELSASFAQRRAQFEAAIHRLSFGPFSPDAFANHAGFSDYCLQWPSPASPDSSVHAADTVPGRPCADHRRDAGHVDDARAERVGGAEVPARAARGAAKRRAPARRLRRMRSGHLRAVPAHPDAPATRVACGATIPIVPPSACSRGGSPTRRRPRRHAVIAQAMPSGDWRRWCG